MITFTDENLLTYGLDILSCFIKCTFVTTIIIKKVISGQSTQPQIP